jgi:predicted RNase H-like nuclease (RuvC/YqgF family)
MGSLADITEKLLSGKTPGELIRQGYARSSVYRQASRLKKPPLAFNDARIGDLDKELSIARAKIELLQEQNNKLGAENLQLARLLGQTETQIKQLTAGTRSKKKWWQFWKSTEEGDR